MTPFLDDLRERLPLFHERDRFLRLVRSFFQRRRFLEVDAPILVPSAGMEPHLDPFKVTGTATGRAAFLPTSPEFYLKKLLAAGTGPCFSLSPSFRDEASGRSHSPEFLMLEWYRPHENLDAILKDAEALLRVAAKAFLPNGAITRDNVTCDLAAGVEKLELGEAFGRYVEKDWRAIQTRDEWRETARRHGADATGGWSENDCFCYMMLTRVEPELARIGHPVALFGYPRFQGALASERPNEPGVIDRFELFAAGVELANAYQELCDGAEQHRRYEAFQAERAAMGKAAHPPDEQFFAAVDALEPCAGIALGADRLLSLLLDKPLAAVRHGQDS